MKNLLIEYYNEFRRLKYISLLEDSLTKYINDTGSHSVYHNIEKFIYLIVISIVVYFIMMHIYDNYIFHASIKNRNPRRLIS